MAWPLIAAAALAPVVGGIIGNENAKGNERDAKRAREAAMAELMKLSAPGMQEQMVNFDEYSSAGELSPELEALFQQEGSAMEGISLDPNQRAAQNQALAELQSIVSGGGLNDSDKADLGKIRQNSLNELKSQQMNTKEDMARRGMGGSGLELAQRMGAEEAAINQMADSDLQVGDIATQRKLQAISELGNMGSRMEGQQFDQEARKAQARDTISQFNTSLRQRQNSGNVGLKNAAQQTNLGNRQKIKDSNVDIRNQEQTRNKDLYQTQFSNNKDIAALRAGAYDKTAENAAAEAEAKRKMALGIGQGVGTAFAAGAGKGK